MFSAHATSAATHTPAATGGVVALLAPTPPQPLMVQVSTVQATSAAVPPPATGGIIALPTKAAVFLRKQPEYGSADFGEQIAELKAMGAAWGPVTTVFADTPARIMLLCRALRNGTFRKAGLPTRMRSWPSTPRRSQQAS